MGAAIGFALLIIVLGIFLPDVLYALQVFLLTIIEKATIFVETLNIPT